MKTAVLIQHVVHTIFLETESFLLSLSLQLPLFFQHLYKRSYSLLGQCFVLSSVLFIATSPSTERLIIGMSEDPLHLPYIVNFSNKINCYDLFCLNHSVIFKRYACNFTSKEVIRTSWREEWSAISIYRKQRNLVEKPLHYRCVCCQVVNQEDFWTLCLDHKVVV